MIARRRDLRDIYKARFAEVPGVTVFGADGDEEDNVWLASILVDEAVTGWTSSALSAALTAADIESRPLWKPMHLQPVFAGARGEITGTSEQLFRTGLTLPSGSALDDAQRERVFAVIDDFFTTRAT